MAEYSNFNNVFLAKNIVELLKNTEINKNIIKLEKNKQPLLKLIYSLGIIELKIWKTYIITNLANDFIHLSKFFARVIILFDKKPDKSLYLFVNYWDLNNLIIKV